MIYDAAEICTAVCGHASLDREEIGPVVVDRLDWPATGVVCPECPRRQFVYPRGECTAVAATHVDPGLGGACEISNAMITRTIRGRNYSQLGGHCSSCFYQTAV